MLLNDRVAVIHGAGGAIGGAVATNFAREGAKVFLSGRNVASVGAVVDDIVGAGGEADAAQVDALNEDAVEHHVASVIQKAGRIDVVLNAGFSVVQGVPLTESSREDFAHPIATWTITQLLTARAVARHMTRKRSGVILMLSASPARVALASTRGFGVACAAIEGLSRTLAAELGPIGIRVVCLRPHLIGDTLGPEPDLPMAGPEEFRSFIENLTLPQATAVVGRCRKHCGVLGVRQCLGDNGDSGKPHLRHERGLETGPQTRSRSTTR